MVLSLRTNSWRELFCVCPMNRFCAILEAAIKDASTLHISGQGRNSIHCLLMPADACRQRLSLVLLAINARLLLQLFAVSVVAFRRY